ncbi:hypothetical protein U9M48_044925 [Paspalum notatum var. saurae]|uniref:DUF7356 domain-containing protein n=1 Tax=Paspalum notatum var. saurae TaxID=547442 RepID=A0AAQ3V0K9_PASNO
MRRGGALLLLLVAVFAVVAVAEDTADTPPAETNGGSSGAHSGVEKSEQHDETNPNKEHVSHENGARNGTSENNNMGNSTEGTNIRTGDLVQQPEDKDKGTTKSPQVRDFLKDPLIKDCDPSHRCIIENKKFIGCLKVSGEDSLPLSLLMDNKGINPLDVSITAPDYVTLAEGAVHVEANGHRETQVTVSGDAANNTAIVLKIAEENCTINIHNAITRETGRVIRMPLTSTYTLVIGFTFLLFVVVGVCIKLRRTRKQGGGLAYQKLDTAELPVSIGGKKELDQSDKWDDNWGDDWDDEEAPVTPSKPMPNPSSKGLAPRRSTKDGWKD